jgi:hypothetical protein
MHQTHDHAMLALPPPRSRSHSSTARDASSQYASHEYRRLLVASDGGTLSRGALTVAALLAHRDNAQIDVVSVVGSTRRDPLSSLAMAASALRYDLLLIGIGRRGVTCALGYSTAVDLAQRVAVPVLAVPEYFRSLPRRAVVGVDGGAAASAAARAAVRLLERPASVDLVHVARTLVAGYSRELRRWPSLARRDADIGRRLVLLARELDDSDDLHVRQFLLPERDPVAALLRCAKYARANLIALGNQGSAKALPSAKVAHSVLHLARQCVLLCSGTPRLAGTSALRPDETVFARSAPSVA